MHAKAVSALMLVSSMGMTGFAQDVSNGDNSGQVAFAPNIPEIPKIDENPNGVSILGNIEDIPPIDSINFGEGNYPNKNEVVNNDDDKDDDKDDESYSCTTTIEVTVTRSSTLPYCDETSTSRSGTYSFGNGGDDDEDDDSSTKKSSTDSSKSAATSHGMSALYSIAIAAALAAVNVALF
ncbi:hypothetical protein GGI01_003440 [Coemansia sp. RSA 376]|nr:hypothetical protein LPJ71_006727 [Coemansia sp. S17]KAJ2055998.1 hypothetical protein GGH13_007672 [Coemansia sp. S155-1]KAJ2069010.1 hypothetical protein GGI08_000577 [Coemansia sp. S2]KAJ2096698.1 hypothetical protein IW146_010326 [Coemansia sp. RSA 922]KAJ2259756.1 hypothetical protein GGI01_003440 [Coemansia sp. RSA 376]KAJ2452823.1 hypothetical protein GGI03_006726 [Coemansia sp. RSA 2337]